MVPALLYAVCYMQPSGVGPETSLSESFAPKDHLSSFSRSVLKTCSFQGHHLELYLLVGSALSWVSSNDYSYHLPIYYPLEFDILSGAQSIR